MAAAYLSSSRLSKATAGGIVEEKIMIGAREDSREAVPATNALRLLLRGVLLEDGGMSLVLYADAMGKHSRAQRKPVASTRMGPALKVAIVSVIK